MNSRFTIKALASMAFLGTALAASLPAHLATAQGDYSMVNARNTVHIDNCNGCHLPYSPGLLPLSSWQKIMSNLNDHFGVSVQVSSANNTHILSYFEKYALAQGQDTVMGQLAEDLPTPAPIRITELPRFKALHNHASELLGYDEPEPLHTCEGCHRAAASHIFDKALLQIGHGEGRLNDYK